MVVFIIALKKSKFHGNLSDSPLAALELYVKKDKTLIFR
jgi:hypothetical protein